MTQRTTSTTGLGSSCRTIVTFESLNSLRTSCQQVSHVTCYRCSSAYDAANPVVGIHGDMVAKRLRRDRYYSLSLAEIF